MNTTIIRGTYRSGEDVWKFSALDRACIGMVIKGTWVFPVPLPEEMLKSSLSVLLDYYPELAGRVRGGDGIVCDNAGVPFTVCDERSLHANDISGVKDAVNRFANRLNISAFRRGAEAPLTVRMTRLADGCILSVHCAHVCMDGSAFYAFMDNWSKLCRGEEITVPVVDQPRVVPEQNVTKEELTRRAEDMGWHKVGYKELFQGIAASISRSGSRRPASLHFSGQFLDSWEKAFNLRHGANCGTHALLSALIVKLALEAAGMDGDRECEQVSVADMRGRDPRIPPAWVGNAVCNIAAEPIYSTDSVADIACKIENRLGNLFSDGGTEAQRFLQLYIDCLGWKIPWLPFALAGMNARRPTTIYINNFLKFRLYDLDFGTGRPAAVLPHDLPDQVRFWPADPYGGVEVYFTGNLARIVGKLSEPYRMMNTFVEEYGVRTN